MKHRIVITDRSGTRYGEIVNYTKGFQWSRAYNNYGYFKVSLPVDSEEIKSGLISTNDRYIYYYRGDNPDPEFEGLIINVKMKFDASGDFYTVSCFDMLYVCDKLDIDKNYTAQAVKNIVKDMYNLKRTEAILPFELGVNEIDDVQELQVPNATMLKALQALDLFGYGLRLKNRKLDVLYNLGTFHLDDQGLPTDILEYGNGGILNSFEYELDGQSYANKIVALGAGTGINQIKSTSADIGARNDIGLFASYKNYPSVSKQSILDTLSSRDLVDNSFPKRVVSLGVLPGKFDFSVFDVGDVVLAYTKRGNVEISEFVRIMNIDVSVDDVGTESVRLDIELYEFEI